MAYRPLSLTLCMASENHCVILVCNITDEKQNKSHEFDFLMETTNINCHMVDGLFVRIPQ